MPSPLENATAAAPSPQASHLATSQPQLVPVLSGFGNFAIAMSTICILAGGITSFPVGFCGAGGAAIGIGWPLGCLFALTVALTMAQVASAFPRAGGPYQWATALGGNGWGWVTGCFNLAGLITALTAVNRGTCDLILESLRREFGYEPSQLHYSILATLIIVATVSQATVNHWGMRLTSWLTNFSGVLIVIVALGLTGCLLAFSLIRGQAPDLSRLVAFANYSGPPGGGVWPVTVGTAWVFALGFLLPAYTLTGFDASAQTAEETFEPEKNVPKGIVRAVLISGVAGWIMLATVVLTATDMDSTAATGGRSFFTVVRDVLPFKGLRSVLYIGIITANYLCGLAILTAVSRLTWAFARDKGLPGSRYLERVGRHNTPSVAIWTVCAVALLFSLLPYTAVAAVCAMFLYIAYVIPTAWGLLTYGRWPQMGPWHLGRWYRPLAVVCILYCIFLLVIGMQPPNEIAIWIIGATVVGLLALWFGLVRHHFRPTVPQVATTEGPLTEGNSMNPPHSPADAEIQALLAHVPALRGRAVSSKPLGGGLTNRNYRLDVEGESYVLRIAGAGTEMLGIDRQREVACSQAASAAGVGPEVVAYLPEHRALIARFVPGRLLTAEDVRRPEMLRRLGQTLRRCHDHPVPPDLGAFSPFETVRNYHSLAREKNVPLPEELDRALDLLSRIEKEVRTGEPPCLCHNDLLSANFIDDGTTIHIIDWEYGGLGDRFFDLGNFAVNHQLDEAQERALLEAYFGEARPEHLRRLRLMRLVSDMREATWGYLQAAISNLHSPEHYLSYGRKHLDRFLDAAREVV